MVPAGGLSRLSIGTDALLLALPEGTPLALATRPPLAQVLAQPLVIFPRAIAPSLYDAILAFYHRHGAAPLIAQEAIQMQTIVNLVSAGLGIAWVPQPMTVLQRAGVVYRALPASAGAPDCETSLVWPVNAGPVVERFVAHVRRLLPAHARRQTRGPR